MGGPVDSGSFAFRRHHGDHEGAGIVTRQRGGGMNLWSGTPRPTSFQFPVSSRRGSNVIYLWTKTFHLLFVIAWMATVFYLPRILVNVAEAAAQAEVRQRLFLMGRRLYRFGHNMFG